MNKSTTMLVAILAVAPISGVEAGPLKGAVSSPFRGVICDKKAGFCADSEGISMGLTKEYLGEAAEAKMMRQIHKVGMDNFDATSFTLTNGICCKAKQKACYVSKFSDKVDPAHTKALFGAVP